VAIRPIVLATIGLLLLQFWNFLALSDSALSEFVYQFDESDMHATWRWAESIVAQGWLNPEPYHPYTHHMQVIAPLATWHRWWGSAAIFQHSPLYAYVMAAFLAVSKNLLVFQFMQCMVGAALPLLLGWVSWEVFQDRRVAWIAGVVAALYAPFYAYSWLLVRDVLGWMLIAVVLALLARWQRLPTWRNGLAVGVALGLGLWTRESYYLTIPVLLTWMTVFAWRRRRLVTVALAAGAVVVVLSPLMVRNFQVGVPLLATSNRFIESFVLGNAPSSRPAQHYLPREMQALMYAANGDGVAAVVETLRRHDNILDWVWLLLQKGLSFFDPYEPPDNINLYYMEELSPLLAFGLRHWMVLILGLVGCAAALREQWRAQVGLWVFLVSLVAPAIECIVLSRYRQAVMVVWIPWAAFLVHRLWQAARAGQTRTWAALGAAVLVGWALCLGPLARRAPAEYMRPTEFVVSIQIHEAHQEWAQALTLQERLAELRAP
jgi:4-amino-4-deoxy-L-arabinose transferase-like glycosyltransferase